MNAKFLGALESAARLPELIELYQAAAPDHRNLYGRLKRLTR